MIGRGIWFVAGAAAGVYGTVKAKRTAEAFTAEGMRHRMKAASLGARMFREEVAQGRSEAELELRERLEVAGGKHRALDAPEDEGLDTPSLRLDTPGGSSLTAGHSTSSGPRDGYSTTNDTQEETD